MSVTPVDPPINPALFKTSFKSVANPERGKREPNLLWLRLKAQLCAIQVMRLISLHRREVFAQSANLTCYRTKNRREGEKRRH